MFKQIIVVFAALSACALLPVDASAASYNTSDSRTRATNYGPLDHDPVNEWGIGGETYYYSYKEKSLGVETDGVMYGLEAFYARHQQRWTFKLEGRVAIGDIDYSSPGSGTAENNGNITDEIRLTAGYDFYPWQDWTLTPFFGVGYRYLKDDSAGTITSRGARGYERVSQYVYSPLGFALVDDLKNGWTIGGVFEYDIFWRGWQHSNLSDAIPQLNNVDNDQNDGYGIRLSLPITKKGETVDLIIEPFINWWNIDRSDNADLFFNSTLIGFAFEPDNKTVETGAKIIFSF